MLVLLGCGGPPIGMMFVVAFLMLLLTGRIIVVAWRMLGSIFEALRPEPMVDESKLGRGA